MKILDIDLDYFTDKPVTGIAESVKQRLSENVYGSSVWNKKRVKEFVENNLGLCKKKKIKGRVVSGHNEALFFWRELIQKGDLTYPFEVIHVDSHSDLALGYSSLDGILDKTILRPKEKCSNINEKVSCSDDKIEIAGIGDYLLFAIAYQWISKLTYCANPKSEANDDYWAGILKNYHEERIFDKPVENVIQLVNNTNMTRPEYGDKDEYIIDYFKTAEKDPEVPFITIPTVEDVQYSGDFDFVVIAQSPNYTPASADFILDIFRKYIEEI